jgi:hypothetical protein
MVYTVADEFAAEVARLCATPVGERQWAQFLDAGVPRVNADGGLLTGRAHALAEKKRDALQRLYRHDRRVAPWAGTAHGVVQAVSTYEHHEGTVRGTTRPDRNMLRTVTGDFARVDRATHELLSRVLA